MGGKLWIEKEEVVFWKEIATLAPPGQCNTSQRAKSHAEIETSWEPLAIMMREKMTSLLQPGEELRRSYTAISCYEHYFQNYVKKKLSPNAKLYVEDYVKRLKEEEAKNALDDMVSSAASLPAGPNAARPKRATANRKRKATTQLSGRREGGVTHEYINHMSPGFSQIVGDQRASIGVPFPPGDPSYGLQHLMSPLPNPNLAAPWSNGSSIRSHPQYYDQETFAGFFHMSMMPVSQPYTAAPPPMSTAAQIMHGFGGHDDFSHAEGFPQFSPVVAAPTSQVNPQFINPEILQLGGMGAMTGQAPPPQPTYHPQYQANDFDFTQYNSMDALSGHNGNGDNDGSNNAQNGGMADSDADTSFHESLDDPQFEESSVGGVSDVGMAATPQDLQQEEQSFLDAQDVHCDGNGHGGGYAEPNTQNGAMEYSNHQMTGFAADAHSWTDDEDDDEDDVDDDDDDSILWAEEDEDVVQDNDGMRSDQQAQEMIDELDAEAAAGELATGPGHDAPPACTESHGPLQAPRPDNAHSLTESNGPPQASGPAPTLETTAAPDQWRYDFNVWISGLWDDNGNIVTDSRQY